MCMMTTMNDDDDDNNGYWMRSYSKRKEKKPTKTYCLQETRPKKEKSKEKKTIKYPKTIRTKEYEYQRKNSIAIRIFSVDTKG